MSSVSFFASDSKSRSEAYRDLEAPIYALPLILRYEKGNHLTEMNVFNAAAQHMSNLMSDIKVQSIQENWGNKWRNWEVQQYRKIVRRAKPGAFDSLTDTDIIRTDLKVQEGETVSFVSLPPHPVGSPDERIRKFQVAGLELPRTVTEPSLTVDEAQSMVLYPNYDLGASTGKMIAQICHAVQLMIYSSPTRTLLEWESSGRPIKIQEEGTFERTESNNLIEVVDAGFTEIPSNSITVHGAWSDDRYAT